MTKIEFLNKLKTQLGCRNDLQENMELLAIPEWDSLAAMIIVTLYDQEFSIKLDIAEVVGMKTVQDLMDRAGVK